MCSLMLSPSGPPTSVRAFWAQLDRRIAELSENKQQTRHTHQSFFPVVMGSWSDLAELSEAMVAAACMLRRGAIFIFAPQCIQGETLMISFANAFLH